MNKLSKSLLFSLTLPELKSIAQSIGVVCGKDKSTTTKHLIDSMDKGNAKIELILQITSPPESGDDYRPLLFMKELNLNKISP